MLDLPDQVDAFHATCSSPARRAEGIKPPPPRAVPDLASGPCVTPQRRAWYTSSLRWEEKPLDVDVVHAPPELVGHARKEVIAPVTTAIEQYSPNAIQAVIMGLPTDLDQKRDRKKLIDDLVQRRSLVRGALKTGGYLS